MGLSAAAGYTTASSARGGTREGLVGTPLGRPPVILCATPAYLKSHPALKQPADLAAHAGLTAERLVR